MEDFQGVQQASDQKPLSVGDYIVMFIIQIIPIVNIIMLFVWAFGANTNLNKKNYAKAMLIVYLVVVVLWIILFVVAGSALSGMFQSFGGAVY